MDDNRRDARRYLPPALLALVIGAHVVSNLVFIRADQRPSNINELSHVLSAIDFLNNLRNLDDFRAAYLIAFSGYPPGGVIATLFYALFGRVHDTAQISQLVFSVIILVTLYRLGSSLFGRATGVLAAAFLACSPAAVEVSRQFLLEWPLTAMGTAAVYALWRSEGFTQKGWAYAAGALIGAASLCKQSFLIFLAGPLVFAIVLWALAMRSGDGGRMEFKPASRVFKALLATAAVLALTRFIYTPVTRSAIDGWYSATVHVNAHVGLLVMIVTGVTGALVAAIAVLGRGALFNALGAGGLSFLVASIWYLPHGLNNLRQYGDQMRMNVATMNPTSLMNFYYHHLFDYYLGVIGVVMLLPVAIVVVALRIARKPLARHFFHSERLIAKGRWIFILAWLIVPSVAFLFINIQNEMNTVPLMPSMAMVQAAFVSRLFLPYNRRRRADIEAGRRPPATARAIRTGVGAVGALVTAAIVGAGLLTALPFSDGKGGYKPLPMTGGDSVLVAKYFPRKNNTLNYLVPLPDEWHVDEIAKEVVRATATRAPGYLLSMDVNFYFSW
ncbi:glycosyltransferase family 39 protein, partial [bacterium]|nr:glycosyltransferase family 39 protein [bacterium]